LERFFVGTHLLAHTKTLHSCFVSANLLYGRNKDLEINDWIMDSGAFTEISRHGKYRVSENLYAENVIRWSRCGNMIAAVTQDYMCEPFILKKTGLSVREHQELTIDRFIKIRNLLPGNIYLMPVLQGYTEKEYLNCAALYGKLLKKYTYVGMESICKRNKDPLKILSILRAINYRYPYIKIHAFGIKTTSLQHIGIRKLIFSADSMAWSFNERAKGNGPGANDPKICSNFLSEMSRYITHDESIKDKSGG